MFKHCYCQNLDAAGWHEVEQKWDQPRYFYRVTTRMAFHNPFTYNEDISRAMMEAKGNGYLIKPDFLILLKSGLFRGEIFLEVLPPRDERTEPCHKLAGTFYTYTTQTPLSQMGELIDRILRDLKKKGRKAQDIYLCLVTCPLCIREKGNKTMIMVNLQ